MEKDIIFYRLLGKSIETGKEGKIRDFENRELAMLYALANCSHISCSIHKITVKRKGEVDLIDEFLDKTTSGTEMTEAVKNKVISELCKKDLDCGWDTILEISQNKAEEILDDVRELYVELLEECKHFGRVHPNSTTFYKLLGKSVETGEEEILGYFESAELAEAYALTVDDHRGCNIHKITLVIYGESVASNEFVKEVESGYELTEELIKATISDFRRFNPIVDSYAAKQYGQILAKRSLDTLKTAYNKNLERYQQSKEIDSVDPGKSF